MLVLFSENKDWDVDSFFLDSRTGTLVLFSKLKDWDVGSFFPPCTKIGTLVPFFSQM